MTSVVGQTPKNKQKDGATGKLQCIQHCYTTFCDFGWLSIGFGRVWMRVWMSWDFVGSLFSVFSLGYAVQDVNHVKFSVHR